MNINGKEVKSIRPMTDKELEEYTRNRYFQSINKPIFCIEFINGSLLLPKNDCLTCMVNSNCLFSLVEKMP
jgi:hypothetical protein